MSIFQSVPSIPWTPTIQTAAPMTVSGLTVNLARYGVSGGWCFFGVSVSFTVGGVVAAQSVDIPFPVRSGVAVAAFGIVGNMSNGGAVNVTQSAAIFGAQTLSFFKMNGVARVAWVAGASVITASGAYPLY